MMRSNKFLENAMDYEKKIANNLENILTITEGDNPSDWTKAIYKSLSLSKLNEQNSKIACSRLSEEEKDCGEWLYDYVEYEENNDSNSLKNIILVAESEWQHYRQENYFSDLKFDFEKLLVAKSDYRLFVFENNTMDEVKENIEKLKEIIKNFDKKQIGERFLFAGWIKSKKFYFDLFVV